MPILPLQVDFNSPQASNTDFTLTVSVSVAVTADTPTQLYCTNTSLVTASGGGAFPTSLVIPNGSNHVSVTLHTGSPGSDTNVTLAVGLLGADMTNPANWHGSKVLLIHKP